MTSPSSSKSNDNYRWALVAKKSTLSLLPAVKDDLGLTHTELTELLLRLLLRNVELSPKLQEKIQIALKQSIAAFDTKHAKFQFSSMEEGVRHISNNIHECRKSLENINEGIQQTHNTLLSLLEVEPTIWNEHS